MMVKKMHEEKNPSVTNYQKPSAIRHINRRKKYMQKKTHQYQLLEKPS
jgi:hypothetical protein